MRDFEKPRYEAALKAFADAFHEGYTEGIRILEADATRSDVRFPIVIDVPRSAVLNDEWRAYVRLFVHAGLQAALSLQRKGRAQLDATDAHDNSPTGFFDNKYRWHVVDRVVEP
jgi:hypothetical protein